jgi:hypothetical protein
MTKKILFITFLALILCAEVLSDNVECFRQKDSSFGHFATCSATKPLPLKVETTFTLDKAYAWSALSYDVALFDGVTKQTTSLSKCLQGNYDINFRQPGPRKQNSRNEPYFRYNMQCYTEIAETIRHDPILGSFP